ncbi:MAG: hypothetical protein WCP16_10810 [Pseudanabaena sp. ELA645]
MFHKIDNSKTGDSDRVSTAFLSVSCTLLILQYHTGFSESKDVPSDIP